jgi:hypothetical protein
MCSNKILHCEILLIRYFVCHLFAAHQAMQPILHMICFHDFVLLSSSYVCGTSTIMCGCFHAANGLDGQCKGHEHVTH